MAHWGWYWLVKKKHVKMGLCSNLPAIDSFLLYRSDCIGVEIKPLEIVCLKKEGSLEVSYRKQKRKPYSIKIDVLACNYGGLRYYFRCPMCDTRMRFLYLAEHRVFLCRQCLNLAYKSQLLRPSRRSLYMASKLRDCIATKGGDIDLDKKPPRMRQATFDGIKQLLRAYEHNSAYESNKELRKWYGPKIEPYLDGFYDFKVIK